MKQIHSVSEEYFPISQGYLPAKKPMGQPNYLLSPEDWEDLEFASLCWVAIILCIPNSLLIMGKSDILFFNVLHISLQKRNSKACHQIPSLCHLTIRH